MAISRAAGPGGTPHSGTTPNNNIKLRPTSERQQQPGTDTTSSQRGGCRRARRARAGFEIDHSEPQARVWRSRGRPGPKAPHTQAPHHNLEPPPTSARRRGPEAHDTQAVLTDTSVSREKRGPLRTGNRVPSSGPRPAWRPPRLCRGRPEVPQPARSRGGRR